MIILKIYMVMVFALIGCIHIYWASGGTKGIKVAIPENEKGPLFKAEFGGTIFIAIIFVIGSLLVIIDIYKIDLIFLQRYLYYIIGPVFFARVIGEFKYVGVFKRVNKTDFAKYDNFIYIPLCFSIALSSVIIIIN
ncbi:MAG: DUF3995 domain-containing protein [Leptospirales bacterium]